jgi:hypothetical protein
VMCSCRAAQESAVGISVVRGVQQRAAGGGLMETRAGEISRMLTAAFANRLLTAAEERPTIQ